MSCKEYREILHSYANNELDEIQQAAISEHLESCAACSNELTEIKRLKQMLRALTPEAFQLEELKGNIMSVIRANKKKVAAYDIKVLTRLGTSMVACGIIALVLNFTSLGAGLTQYAAYISPGLGSTSEKINQPMTFINERLVNMSDGIVNLDGMMFRLGQKIKGGM